MLHFIMNHFNRKKHYKSNANSAVYVGLAVFLFTFVVVLIMGLIPYDEKISPSSSSSMNNAESYIRHKLSDTIISSESMNSREGILGSWEHSMFHRSKISSTQSLVSYIVDDTCGNANCENNLNFFFKHGVVRDQNIRYVFSVLGKNQSSCLIYKLADDYPNVQIIETNHEIPKLTIHGDVISKYMGYFDSVVILSCQVQGPFYPIASSKSSISWMDPFIKKLTGNVKVVSSTISCEGSLHSQSYALLMDATAAKVAVGIWSTKYSKQLISSMNGNTNTFLNLEISFTKTILSKGYNIASLDSRHAGRDFLKSDICDPQFESLGNSKFSDPLICYKDTSGPMIDTPGCMGVDPCETIFVYSPDPVNTAKETLDHIQEEILSIEKNQSLAYMCAFSIAPARPFWDIRQLYQKVSTYSPNKELLSKIDNISNMVIIIRGHSSYSSQLVSFLWTLDSIRSNHQVLVVIIPTEDESMPVLKDKVVTGFINPNPKSKVKVLPIDIPSTIFTTYGAYLSKLCTPEWKNEMVSSGKHSAHDVSRHCDVNSPLHYLLVDIALYHVKEKCKSCKRLLVTNADNLYSPQFFETILSEKYKDHDVVMTNMITRGYVFPVQPARRRVDLGAYATSLDFLRRTGVTFLNSIPSHPQANDYHDADGHFISSLVAYHAKVAVVQEYYFYHV